MSRPRMHTSFHLSGQFPSFMVASLLLVGVLLLLEHGRTAWSSQVASAERARAAAEAALEEAAGKLRGAEAAQQQHLAACAARQAAAAERETALDAAVAQTRDDLSVVRCGELLSPGCVRSSCLARSVRCLRASICLRGR